MRAEAKDNNADRYLNKYFVNEASEYFAHLVSDGLPLPARRFFPVDYCQQKIEHRSSEGTRLLQVGEMRRIEFHGFGAGNVTECLLHIFGLPRHACSLADGARGGVFLRRAFPSVDCDESPRTDCQRYA